MRHKPLLALTLILGLVAANAHSQQPPCSITAGLFMPLSGPAATIGDDFRRAALMSHDKLPEAIRQRVKLVFEDTQLNATVAVSAHRALAIRARPDVLVVSFAESVQALAPIAQRSKTPLIGCGPTRDFLTDRPFTFRHWTDPESMSPLLVDELLRQEKREIALVFSEHPAMADFAQYFQKYGQSRGIKFVMASSLLPGDTDFRSIVTQITSKKPQAVVYFFLPPQPSQFAKQFRSLDPNTPLFSFINTESEGEVAAANGALEGVVYVGPKFSDNFIQEFKERHQGGYPEICSGNFYDIVQMLGQAAAAGSCSGESLRAFIQGLKSFNGVAGSYGISDTREFKLNLELRTVRDGTFVKYRQ
ncbi:MAG: ABC transporter substrate-binding protein [Pseudomonadota bacterium]